jgi:hypothetical protein
MHMRDPSTKQHDTLTEARRKFAASEITKRLSETQLTHLTPQVNLSGQETMSVALVCPPHVHHPRLAASLAAAVLLAHPPSTVGAIFGM